MNFWREELQINIFQDKIYSKVLIITNFIQLMQYLSIAYQITFIRITQIR